ncbi:cytochrome P450 [Fodinicola acaciae]|uniref:cytochrome P450 n=1 Tax=Fodinicola acaciae TaxID=2681555 RepID=UPI001C9E7F7F|nr:cytochrome P450 [Fodinicola acaciae]
MDDVVLNGPPAGVETAWWWYRIARDPLGTYGKLARKYGDAVRLRYGLKQSVLLLSRPEFAEHILVANQDNYVKSFTYRPLRTFLGSGLLTSEGEVWRRHRRLVQPVFAHRRISAFAPAMVEATDAAVGRWRAGQALDSAAMLRRLTLDIVGRVLFGADLGGHADRLGVALGQLQHRVFVAMFLPSGAEPALRAAARRPAGELDRLVRTVIAERKRDGGGDRAPDLLDLMMSAGDGGGLTDAELRDEVLTLMLAGHETTAATLTWTFLLLSRFPAARERLEAEVDAIGRPLRADDLDKLPWTRAVLSESMRLYPPAWTVERDAVRADSVSGIDIPAGATVVTSPYLIHRRPDLWPNPEGFQPERFLEKTPKYAYLPFGGGKRICVGAGFATQESMLVLATIARTHRLDLLPGVTVTPRAEITLRPAGPVPMRVLAR